MRLLWKRSDILCPGLLPDRTRGAAHLLLRWKARWDQLYGSLRKRKKPRGNQSCREFLDEGRISLKSTGVIRKVDKLSRFVIPKEIRDQLELFCDTPLGIYVDGDRIILRKDLPACCFCENEEGLTCFRGQNMSVSVRVRSCHFSFKSIISQQSDMSSGEASSSPA